MPLTPADVHNMAFKKPPIGKRGYDEEEVDAFLDEVEQELIRLLEENGALQDQVQRGGASGAAATTMVLPSEFADVAAKLERMQEARARAEQNARSLQTQLEQARTAAPAVPASAGDDERHARVLMMAQRTADDHLIDARQEAEALLAAARDQAAQLTGEAQLRAGTIEGDARRNHSDAMNSLGVKREALLDEIDRLAHLAQSYQVALQNHLMHQMEELDSEPKLPPDHALG
ncbi:DivIVA domain-containing protein [Couchioplanes caeruleus]|uniref:Cell wall synthesis protein Wag31 n=2 Tax=Couchioplanes caeruleus TaxID=56438 RepID=A0A1K0FQ95_9ACTN|nr:DivIVA domain-containing protein [Couchioplanes caeruleus]OJF15013.1 cell division protein DivIVA [Couchioplanes caeruleus subsp. caeruleus]ROP28923.1 DivIVA domain-containing protein [Couchioplanes caeruleus]